MVIALLKKKEFYRNSNIIDLSSPHLENELTDFADIKVSVRERECLKFLVAGKTTKETAKIMNLSPRTVEDYLNRLKKKVGCQYKRELISLLSKTF